MNAMFMPPIGRDVRQIQQAEEKQMSFKLTIDKATFDALNDQQKPFYAEKDGSYVLDIEGGAVAQADYDALKTTNEELTGKVNGPDGKSWKDMFEGSQTANKAIRTERDAFKVDLDKWIQAFGKIEDAQTMKDELEGFRKQGKNLDEAQKEIAALKGNIRTLTEERDTLKTQNGTLATERDELAAFKKTAQEQADFAEAQRQIIEVVDKLEGANKRALTRSLLKEFNGELVFGDDRKLFCKKSNETLSAYAKRYLEDYGFYAVNPNQPGGANPPGGGQVGGGNNNGVVNAASIAAMLGGN